MRGQLHRLLPQRTCLDCGFLAFGDQEATAEDRARLYTRGQLGGLPGPVNEWRCFRNLWDWGLHYTEPNWDAVLGEVHYNRRACSGFCHHSGGRLPADHFQIEKDSTEFRRKLWLGLLPLLYGSIGAAIAWLWRP